MATVLSTLLVSPLRAAESTFKAMTFNNRYCKDRWSAGIFGGDSPNNWDRRIEHIDWMINREEDPDLIGMQEQWSMQRVDLRKRMSRYQIIGAYRKGGRSGTEDGDDESCPVVLKKDRFEQLDGGTFWLYHGAPTVGPSADPSTFYGSACHRICTWSRVKDKRNGNQFIFASTHLDHMGGEAPQRGADVIMSQLSRMPYPIVLVGDMNDRDFDKSCLVFRKSMTGTAQPGADGSRAQGCTYHAFNGGTAGDPIDHIYVTQGMFKITNCKVHTKTYTSNAARWPSDHYAVMATLTLKDPAIKYAFKGSGSHNWNDAPWQYDQMVNHSFDSGHDTTIAPSADTTLKVTSPLSARTLTLGASGKTLTLSGDPSNSLVATKLGIAGNAVINLGVPFGYTVEGAATWVQDIDIPYGTTLRWGGNYDQRMTGWLSGYESSVFAKAGNGLLTFGGDSYNKIAGNLFNFTGKTIVEGGTLRLAANDSGGKGAFSKTQVTINAGATLELTTVDATGWGIYTKPILVAGGTLRYTTRDTLSRGLTFSSGTTGNVVLAGADSGRGLDLHGSTIRASANTTGRISSPTDIGMMVRNGGTLRADQGALLSVDVPIMASTTEESQALTIAGDGWVAVNRRSPVAGPITVSGGLCGTSELTTETVVTVKSGGRLAGGATGEGMLTLRRVKFERGAKVVARVSQDGRSCGQIYISTDATGPGEPIAIAVDGANRLAKSVAVPLIKVPTASGLVFEATKESGVKLTSKAVDEWYTQWSISPLVWDASCTIQGVQNWLTAPWSVEATDAPTAANWLGTIPQATISARGNATLAVDTPLAFKTLTIATETGLTITNPNGHDVAIETIDCRLDSGTTRLNYHTGNSTILAGRETILSAGGTGQLNVTEGKALVFEEILWDETKLATADGSLIYRSTATTPTPLTEMPFATRQKNVHVKLERPLTKTGDLIFGRTNSTAPLESTFTIGASQAVSVSRRFKNQGQGVTTTVIQEPGSSIVVSGSDTNPNEGAAVLMGHWRSSNARHTLTQATFDALNGTYRLGWDSSAALILKQGATLSASGIIAGYGKANPATVSVTDSTLKVGAKGMRFDNANQTLTLSNGTLVATANTLVSLPKVDLLGDARVVAQNQANLLMDATFTIQNPTAEQQPHLYFGQPDQTGRIAVIPSTVSGLLAESGVTIEEGTTLEMGADFIPSTATGANESNYKTIDVTPSDARIGLSQLHLARNPGTEILPNNHVMELAGTIIVPESEAGDYTFAGTWDDKIALWIDDTLVFESPAWNTIGRGTRSLTAGTHDFKVRVLQVGGGLGPAQADWQAAAMSLGYAKGSITQTTPASYIKFDTVQAGPLLIRSALPETIQGRYTVKGTLAMGALRPHLAAIGPSSTLAFSAESLDAPLELSLDTPPAPTARYLLNGQPVAMRYDATRQMLVLGGYTPPYTAAVTQSTDWNSLAWRDATGLTVSSKHILAAGGTLALSHDLSGDAITLTLPTPAVILADALTITGTAQSFTVTAPQGGGITATAFDYTDYSGALTIDHTIGDTPITIGAGVTGFTVTQIDAQPTLTLTPRTTPLAYHTAVTETVARSGRATLATVTGDADFDVMLTLQGDATATLRDVKATLIDGHLVATFTPLTDTLTYTPQVDRPTLTWDAKPANRPFSDGVQMQPFTTGKSVRFAAGSATTVTLTESLTAGTVTFETGYTLTADPSASLTATQINWAADTKLSCSQPSLNALCAQVIPGQTQTFSWITAPQSGTPILTPLPAAPADFTAAWTTSATAISLTITNTKTPTTNTLAWNVTPIQPPFDWMPIMSMGEWSTTATSWRNAAGQTVAFTQGDRVSFPKIESALGDVVTTVTIRSQVTATSLTTESQAFRVELAAATGVRLTVTESMTLASKGVLFSTPLTISGHLQIATTHSGMIFNPTAGNDQTLSGTLSGIGTLTKQGEGKWIWQGLTQHPQTTTTPAIHFETGTLDVQGASQLPHTIVAMSNQTTLRLTAPLTLKTLTVPTGTLTLALDLPWTTITKDTPILTTTTALPRAVITCNPTLPAGYTLEWTNTALVVKPPKVDSTFPEWIPTAVQTPALKAAFDGWVEQYHVTDTTADYSQQFLLGIAPDAQPDLTITQATFTEGTATVTFAQDKTQFNGTITLIYTNDLKTWTAPTGRFVKAILTWPKEATPPSGR